MWWKLTVCLAALLNADPRLERPTTARPRGESLFVWRDGGETYYTFGTEGLADEAMPEVERWDIAMFAVAGGNPAWREKLWGAQLVREVPINDMIRAARREAAHSEEPMPCYPGEWPGDLARP